DRQGAVETQWTFHRSLTVAARFFMAASPGLFQPAHKWFPKNDLQGVFFGPCRCRPGAKMVYYGLDLPTRKTIPKLFA
ncbi:MAG TPA: hypothetical protein VJL29_04145, partial [Thermoguttaceae bacterium]|nr:hypothetical protein [Thermoguttaceae bacterium]